MNSELLKLFKDELNNIDKEDEDDICLISHEKKDYTYTKLLCNHGFNYKNIYKEIISQKIDDKKLSFNKLNLKVFQIKCPYCRNIQDKLLPPMENFDLIRGVNTPSRYTMTRKTCQYIFKKGKKMGNYCGVKCLGEYCKSHEKVINKQK